MDASPGKLKRSASGLSRLHFQRPNISQYQMEHNSQISLKADYSRRNENWGQVLVASLLAVNRILATLSKGTVFGHIGAMLLMAILVVFKIAMQSRTIIFRISPFVFRVLLLELELLASAFLSHSTADFCPWRNESSGTHCHIM